MLKPEARAQEPAPFAGMTRRDYIAIEAMKSVLAREKLDSYAPSVAHFIMGVTDAMVAALDKEPGK